MTARNKTTAQQPSAKVAPKVGMQRMHITSLPNVIAALELGHTYSESKRYAFDSTSKVVLLEETDNMRNLLAKSTNLATRRSGNKYVVEGGTFFTRTNDVIVTIAVTRTA